MLGHQVRRPGQPVEARPLVIAVNKTLGVGSRGCHWSAARFADPLNPLCLKLGDMFFLPSSLWCGHSLSLVVSVTGRQSGAGVSFLPLASLWLGLRAALDEWLGGWRIVRFPVVHFQESLRLSSSLKSFISSFTATDCK